MWMMLFAFAAQAQSFETPIKSLMGPEGIAVLADGTEVKGNPAIIPKGIGNIKKLTLKMEDGSKMKLGPSDIKSFALKPNKLAKLASSSTSIVAASSGKDADVWSKDYAWFVPAKLPNGKPAILQHLNRDFDSTMQIFADPAGRETGGVAVGGVSISGGMLKSYLVLKEGADQSVLVKKGTYDKLWTDLYGDCSGMTKPEKAEFKDFAADVSNHAATCGG